MPKPPNCLRPSQNCFLSFLTQPVFVVVVVFSSSSLFPPLGVRKIPHLPTALSYHTCLRHRIGSSTSPMANQFASWSKRTIYRGLHFHLEEIPPKDGRLIIAACSHNKRKSNTCIQSPPAKHVQLRINMMMGPQNDRNRIHSLCHVYIIIPFCKQMRFFFLY